MARAKTLTGLFFQYIGARWGALGKRGRFLVFTGLVLASATALHFGACYFGACEASEPCSTPCSAGAADEAEPCPYAARAAAEEEAEAEADEDVPPCHRR